MAFSLIYMICLIPKYLNNFHISFCYRLLVKAVLVRECTVYCFNYFEFVGVCFITQKMVCLTEYYMNT